MTPAKFCGWVISRLCFMDNPFIVVQISAEPTRNGNRIVKIQRKESVEDEFGTSDSSETYYRAVKADSVKVKVDDVMPDTFSPDNYRIVEREHEFMGDDEMIVRTLKWLHTK